MMCTYNGVCIPVRRAETMKKIWALENKNVLSEEQFLKNNLEFFRVISDFFNYYVSA